jgi:hypothetical protein
MLTMDLHSCYEHSISVFVLSVAPTSTDKRQEQKVEKKTGKYGTKGVFKFVGNEDCFGILLQYFFGGFSPTFAVNIIGGIVTCFYDNGLPFGLYAIFVGLLGMLFWWPVKYLGPVLLVFQIFWLAGPLCIA